MWDFRVGIGFDSHAFAPRRPLILGGVEIEHDRGLAGHSDADVLAHAVADAVLGAAGERDIGEHFPNTDETWKDANSLHLLALVAKKVGSAGWVVMNLDAVILCDSPRIGPYKGRIIENLARVLGIETEQVNLKGKSTEGLSPLDGIAAQAVVLLRKLEP